MNVLADSILVDFNVHVTCCVHCGHDRISKHGYTSAGTQRFRCSSCRRTFTPYSGSQFHRIQKREIFIKFARLMSQCNSLRADARLLGVSPATVWRWRHRILKELCRHEGTVSPGIDTAVLTSQTLDCRRMVWGKAGNHAWQHRHREKLIFIPEPKEGFKPVLSFCVAGKTSSPLVLFFSVRASHAVASRLYDPSMLGKLYRQATVFVAHGGRMIALNGTRTARPTPSVSVTPGWKRRPATTEQRLYAALEDLRDGFFRWLGRFRGVAVKYLNAYAAWFTQLLTWELLPDDFRRLYSERCAWLPL